MRRILVPLDGSDLARSILSDARRLAGPDGTIILIRAIQASDYEAESAEGEWSGLSSAEVYLESQAAQLVADGVDAEYHVLCMGPTTWSIDEAVTIYKADMIACATHGRSPMSRLLRGGVAWNALAHSSVPVLVRHPEDGQTTGSHPGPRRIMVPLDGSTYAEKALPLARQLAKEWEAHLWLAQAVPTDIVMAMADIAVVPGDIPSRTHDAYQYLRRVACGIGGDVQVGVFDGPADMALKAATEAWSITDVVMASHGRTGLARVILGSVADSLVHHLHCPIIIIPSLAAKAAESSEARAGVLV